MSAREQLVELTPEQEERITALYSQLDGLDLYQLLGVARAADKKTIKRAYNERALAFHPDRFFRKRLGAFQSRLEKIFSRLTEAHDVLCSAERRAAYDAMLRTKRQSFIQDLFAEEQEMAGAADASRREEISFDDDVRVEPLSAQRRYPSIGFSSR